LVEDLLATTFVLASSIWLLEGPPMNDLMTIVKMRRNLRRQDSKPVKVTTISQLLSA